ncbi:alpha/beta fold hydrolase [Pseudonocardia nigra]|uniref:alpha/beta fold hydrolase n=1 Tax=Pseudonocardia nigra TaxID=1921578 RepID=UPI001C5EBD05|nr:alpha/beta hydrolase [Pseudonocardia nigra]
MPHAVTEEVRLSDGARLWTRSAPEAGRPAAVFVHGGPGMWDHLGPLAGMLAGLAGTHRYDQRGCGRSAPDTDFRLDRFVADLDELRAHFGHDRWFVVGHSFGATLGLAYAAARPERVAGLVYCSGVGLDWPGHRAAHRERARARLTPAQRARRDALQQRDRSWPEEVEWRTFCWLPDFADPERRWELAAADAATPLPLNRECNRALNAETDARADAERTACARVTAPVLAIHGAADPRPVAGVEALVDALPSARLAVLDGAGHQPWRERPAATRALLREFVAAHTAP